MDFEFDDKNVVKVQQNIQNQSKKCSKNKKRLVFRNELWKKIPRKI